MFQRLENSPRVLPRGVYYQECVKFPGWNNFILLSKNVKKMQNSFAKITFVSALLEKDLQ